MKSIFLAVLLSLSAILNAQGSAEAKEAITLLKGGALIVNLIQPQKKIEALLADGRKEEAMQIQSQAETEHQSLINAFANNYSFSKVLFVYSSDVGRFTEGDPTALFNTDGTNETGMPEHYYYVELTQTVGRGLTGFVVKKPNRDELTKPFPYFVSRYEFFNLKELSFVEMVLKLDAKLSAYYNKALRH